jgi:hypothetical protein
VVSERATSPSTSTTCVVIRCVIAAMAEHLSDEPRDEPVYRRVRCAMILRIRVVAGAYAIPVAPVEGPGVAVHDIAHRYLVQELPKVAASLVHGGAAA